MESEPVFLFCSQVDHTREIMKKYEEQTLQHREMTQEITDLRTQLLETRQGEVNIVNVIVW